MFNFIHTYLPDTPYWDGLVKRGFIDDTSGVKLMQSAPTPPSVSFNEAARIGSTLFEMIREAKRPFYVDRLQGGSFYYRYPFSKDLIDSYYEMLGSRFLGFQMHEWASNYWSDWCRIEQSLEGNTKPWTAETIRDAIQNKFPYPHLFLESQSAEEFAEKKRPSSLTEMLQHLESLFRRRMESVNNHLLPADSAFIGARFEVQQGVRNLMPEIGSQIRFTRIQIALTRGVSRTSSLQWGTYYEPWGGEPFSTCYYKKDPADRMVNEWQIEKRSDFPFFANGENGGSSRTLQRRLFFYSYLSGAQFISEEWGACNTFRDWSQFELTPYGKIKKEFLDFVTHNPNRGEPFTPIAFVLPIELPFFDLGWMNGSTDRYLGLPLDNAKTVQKISNTFLRIFGDGKPRFGNEAHVITNSAYGDLFDIVYEDDPNIFSRYEYVVDLTGKADFAKRHFEKSGRILQADDQDLLEHELQPLIDQLLPIKVEGNVHWLINRREGGWIVAFFNNEGVYRTGEEGEVLLPEADAEVRIVSRSETEFVSCFGAVSPVREKTTLRFILPAGQVAVFAMQ